MAKTDQTVFTKEELKKHDTEDSAWVAIEGFVYDITSFLEEHPGGKEIVLNHLGTDATSVFTDEAIHSHSEAAFSMLARYRIGSLKGAAKVDRTGNNAGLVGLVDVRKPMIPQIPKLGEKYQPWLHSQTGLNKIIIFDSFLESLTRWPWWYIFILWTPYVVWALNENIKYNSVFSTASIFTMGMLSWSIVEYILHRFVFHMSSNTTMWNYFHFFAHGIHHLTPNDSTRLTFPPTFSAAIMYLFMRLPGWIIPYSTGILAFYAGLATGFVLYDTCHYYFHHGEATWLPVFLQQMKTAHLNHHYKDDTANFGVSSPLFDWVFGTLAKPSTRQAS